MCTAKAVARGEFIAMSAYFSKSERSQKKSNTPQSHRETRKSQTQKQWLERRNKYQGRNWWNGDNNTWINKELALKKKNWQTPNQTNQSIENTQINNIGDEIEEVTTDFNEQQRIIRE